MSLRLCAWCGNRPVKNGDPRSLYCDDRCKGGAERARIRMRTQDVPLSRKTCLCACDCDRLVTARDVAFRLNRCQMCRRSGTPLCRRVNNPKPAEKQAELDRDLTTAQIEAIFARLERRRWNPQTRPAA